MQGDLSRRFGILLAAAGLGLCGYAGVQWYELPRYSDADLKDSAELNLQLDLVREGSNPSQLDPARLDQRRRQVLAEVQQEVAAQQRHPWNWLLAGLALLVGGVARFWAGKIR
jgi:hypothetical protein